MYVLYYLFYCKIIPISSPCSVGGLILDFTVVNYRGIAVFQPVINGKSVCCVET